MSYWHKSTELPEHPVVPCLIAERSPDGHWMLTEEHFTWHELFGAWLSDSCGKTLQPGDDFRWGYEIELFAELEHEDEEEAAHV